MDIKQRWFSSKNGEGRNCGSSDTSLLTCWLIWLTWEQLFKSWAGTSPWSMVLVSSSDSHASKSRVKEKQTRMGVCLKVCTRGEGIYSSVVESLPRCRRPWKKKVHSNLIHTTSLIQFLSYRFFFSAWNQMYLFKTGSSSPEINGDYAWVTLFWWTWRTFLAFSICLINIFAEINKCKLTNF
jgi:hypothetical protein